MTREVFYSRVSAKIYFLVFFGCFGGVFVVFNLAVTLPAVWWGFGVGTLTGGESC